MLIVLQLVTIRNDFKSTKVLHLNSIRYPFQNVAPKKESFLKLLKQVTTCFSNTKWTERAATWDSIHNSCNVYFLQYMERIVERRQIQRFKVSVSYHSTPMESETLHSFVPSNTVGKKYHQRNNLYFSQIIFQCCLTIRNIMIKSNTNHKDIL